jgi:hypothetical protein
LLRVRVRVRVTRFGFGFGSGAGIDDNCAHRLRLGLELSGARS